MRFIIRLEFILLVGFILVSATGCQQHPTDSDMLKNFKADHISLSNIVVALKGMPNVGRIEWNESQLFGDRTQKLSEEVSLKLLPHFIGIKRPLLVFANGDASRVMFHYSRSGISVSGSSKGIAYQLHSPRNVVVSTDPWLHTNALGTVFRPIENHWYVFFSR